MPMIILKYKLPMSGKLFTYNEFEIEMPMNSKFLSFQEQHGEPVIWYLMDTSLEINIKRKRKFRTYGTGIEIDYDYKDASLNYIGTIQLRHLFEIFE